MTDIAVGEALWNDLVRQVAVRTRNYDDAEDLLHTAYLRLVRYQAQTPVDNVAAFLLRTAINANIDSRRHSSAVKNAAITRQLEDSAPLQDEIVGTRIRLIRTKAGLDNLPPKTRQHCCMRSRECDLKSASALPANYALKRLFCSRPSA